MHFLSLSSSSFSLFRLRPKVLLLRSVTPPPAPLLAWLPLEVDWERCNSPAEREVEVARGAVASPLVTVKLPSTFFARARDIFKLRRCWCLNSRDALSSSSVVLEGEERYDCALVPPSELLLLCYSSLPTIDHGLINDSTPTTFTFSRWFSHWIVRDDGSLDGIAEATVIFYMHIVSRIW